MDLCEISEGMNNRETKDMLYRGRDGLEYMLSVIERLSAINDWGFCKQFMEIIFTPEAIQIIGDSTPLEVCKVFEEPNIVTLSNRSYGAFIAEMSKYSISCIQGIRVGLLNNLGDSIYVDYEPNSDLYGAVAKFTTCKSIFTTVDLYWIKSMNNSEQYEEQVEPKWIYAYDDTDFTGACFSSREEVCNKYRTAELRSIPEMLVDVFGYMVAPEYLKKDGILAEKLNKVYL